MRSLWRSSFLTLLLVAADAVALLVVWSVAYDVRAGYEGNLFWGRTLKPMNLKAVYSAAAPLLLPLWLLVLARYGFYAHHERIAGLNRLGPILWATFWMVAVAVLYNFVVKKSDFGRLFLGGFAVGGAAYLWGLRTIFRLAKRAAVRAGHGRVRVLVVGGGDLGVETLRRVREHPDIGFEVLGFVAASPEERRDSIEGYAVLGHVDALEALVQRHRVEEVFFAAADMPEEEIFHRVCSLQSAAPVVCKVVANVLYVIANRSKVDEVIGLPVIAFRGTELTPAGQALKRALDLALGGMASLLLLPWALLFAVLIRLDSPGPALFVHERMGLGGRRFRMLKFRTMHRDAEAYAEAPIDQSDPRVTRFGAFLRRTSLDEIPQFLNVLRGDMSLVGPRPEMPFIVESYTPWQAARLRVKPGVTGLWQVAGRKNLPLHFNLEYDFYYVSNQSLLLDAEILMRTLPAVLLGKGAY
jgi:exopolysaccharide biosynthesis polyprenyl glycosylphosphotransferase